MEQDNGVRAGSRASHGTGDAVSAVPASIPSAEWPEFEYDDGYPEDEEFSALVDQPFDFYRAAHWLLAELPRAAEYMPCFCEVSRGLTLSDRECSVIKFSTGGWSGAESLIGLIKRRHDLSHFMLSWRRGGHFVFEVPDHFLAFRDHASAIEARRGETQSGSVHESAARQGAPKDNPNA